MGHEAQYEQNQQFESNEGQTAAQNDAKGANDKMQLESNGMPNRITSQGSDNGYTQGSAGSTQGSDNGFTQGSQGSRGSRGSDNGFTQGSQGSNSTENHQGLTAEQIAILKKKLQEHCPNGSSTEGQPKPPKPNEGHDILPGAPKPPKPNVEPNELPHPTPKPPFIKPNEGQEEPPLGPGDKPNIIKPGEDKPWFKPKNVPSTPDGKFILPEIIIIPDDRMRKR